MEITRFHTGPKLSRVVVHNHTAYICGQVSEDLSGDIAAQTKGALARLQAHLQEVGSDKSKLLACTVYLKHADDAAAMNAVWNDWLKDCAAPSRTCVVAAFPNSEILVEITSIAAV